jgi:hypothetical protein
MPCDVFVSYAHRDNKVPEGQPTLGFVNRLVSYIEVEGGKKYGSRDIEVWSDEDLASGTLWSQALYEKLATCRVFLPIVSPSWMNSRWAGQEWNAVWNRVKNDQSLGTQTRIIPVSYLLDKGLTATLPAEVRSLQFNRRFRSVMSDVEFQKEADGLASDVANRLKALDKLDQVSVQVSNKAKVFLGFAFSQELKKSRNRVRDELDSRGYGISEVQLDLSWTAQQLSSAIEKELIECAAAVHFLEESGGPSFSGDKRPVVQIQCDLARELKEGFLNLFWTGPLLAGKLEQYPEFIKGLKYNNDPVGDLVGSLLDGLKEREQRVPTLRQQPSAAPIIWVICERGDLEIAPNIVNFFSKKGWAVLIPGFNVAEIPYSQIFARENYFLFYWGKGEKDWCSINYEGLVDARRVGIGFTPPLAALVYAGQAKLEYKEKFQWLFLKAPEYDLFNPEAPNVKEFVAQVERTFTATPSAVRSTV